MNGPVHERAGAGLSYANKHVHKQFMNVRVHERTGERGYRERKHVHERSRGSGCPPPARRTTRSSCERCAPPSRAGRCILASLAREVLARRAERATRLLVAARRRPLMNIRRRHERRGAAGGRERERVHELFMNTRVHEHARVRPLDVNKRVHERVHERLRTVYERFRERQPLRVIGR